jgi:transposase
MKKDYQKRRISARGKVIYVGMDVHKDSWHVTARSADKEIFNGRLPSQYNALQSLFDRFGGCTFQVAYEAGPCGFWLYDKLITDGIETIVVPPSLIPIESGNRVKTDKRDSRKLAQLLERNMLKKVHVLTEEERAHRELVRTRRQIVEHRSSVARQIKSKLLFHGIETPFSGRHAWSGLYLRWLKELVCTHKVLNISLGFLIELYEHLTLQIKNITQKVMELLKNEKYARKVALLQSIPGIGKLVAIQILVELQDVSRFPSAEKIASFVGLTPSEYSTGQSIRQGQITRCGNKRVRTSLVEGSWILIYRDPAMKLKYERLKKRKGAKKAIIALARNLIIRIRKILLSNEPYRFGKLEYSK